MYNDCLYSRLSLVFTSYCLLQYYVPPLSMAYPSLKRTIYCRHYWRTRASTNHDCRYYRPPLLMACPSMKRSYLLPPLSHTFSHTRTRAHTQRTGGQHLQHARGGARGIHLHGHHAGRIHARHGHERQHDGRQHLALGRSAPRDFRAPCRNASGPGLSGLLGCSARVLLRAGGTGALPREPVAVRDCDDCWCGVARRR